MDVENTTPSVEFAIRLLRSPKSLEAFGRGENQSARGGFSSASQRAVSDRSRISDKFKRHRVDARPGRCTPAIIVAIQHNEGRGAP